MDLNQRREVLRAIGALSLAPSMAFAQASKGIRRIGFLSPATERERKAEREAFVDQLRLLGYVDGQNISIAYRWAEGDLEKLSKMAQELVALNVEVIVAHTTLGAVAASKATQKIPVVMSNAADPIATNLVRNLARPGGNLTGLSMLNVELGGKRLGILKGMVPKLSSVSLLWNSDNHGNLLLKQNTEKAARTLGLRLEIHDVRNPVQLKEAFRKMTANKPQGMTVVEDPVTLDHRKELVEFAAAARIPAIYGLSQYVDAGGLASYGIVLLSLFRRAAHYVDKILKGQLPANLPVEQPVLFEMVLNLRAAKALGLNIPPVVMLRVDRTIE